jgi:RNA polymerase sigma factor (sigma-70 family)
MASDPPWSTRPHVERWAHEGNPALGPLFEHFAGDVRALLRRLVKDEGEPTLAREDLLHDVWLELCRQDPATLKFEHRGDFGKYLTQVARHVVISRIREARSQKRRPARAPEPFQSQAAAGARPIAAGTPPPHASQAAIGREFLARVRAVLSDEEFAVWHGRHVEGASESELAARLSWSTRTVRRRHAAALKKVAGLGGADP